MSDIHSFDKRENLSSFCNQAAMETSRESMKADLEIIGYGLSHDLQAPLRAIFNICEQSVNEYPCSDKMAQAVQSIKYEAEQLKILSDGMREYLRLDTYVPKYRLLDSSAIVVSALAELEEKIRASEARVTYDVLPQIYGHQGRLTRLFTGLLDNALKFRNPVPRIHLCAHRAGDFWQFCIKDNGIGIDEEFHHAVFILFQRFHDTQIYPGHGMGLALSRKIVESHGGKIWLESAPGKGSCFQFILPMSSVKETQI